MGKVGVSALWAFREDWALTLQTASRNWLLLKMISSLHWELCVKHSNRERVSNNTYLWRSCSVLREEHLVIQVAGCWDGLRWQLDVDYGASLKQFRRLCLSPECANVSAVCFHSAHCFAERWRPCGIVIESFPRGSARQLTKDWCLSWDVQGCGSWGWVLGGTVRMGRWHSWGLLTGVMQFIIPIEVHKSSGEAVASPSNSLVLWEPFLFLQVHPLAGFITKFLPQRHNTQMSGSRPSEAISGAPWLYLWFMCYEWCSAQAEGCVSMARRIQSLNMLMNFSVALVSITAAILRMFTPPHLGKAMLRVVSCTCT